MQQQKQEDVELTEAASPISSRLPARGNFHELEQVSGVVHEEDALVGDESERGLAGNRWPRQETLALLKIRSDMDAAFRDATVKGPLWEDVSRKLAELGYKRNARKCKEKFENVHKYYKRTKEGRVGRQHGKSYRFFSQLEALNSAGGTPTSASAASAALSLSPVTAPVPVPVSAAIGFSGTMDVSSSARSQPPPPSASPAVASHTYVLRTGPDLTAEPITGVSGSAAAVAGISFSSNTSSSSSDSEEEEETEEGPTTGIGKRKRSGSEGGRRKMMTFFEGLMRQVMEKQEEMQQRFLEAIEKREQDRMAREEAWKRQEMARLAHEHEILAQERAMSASREAAVIACLQQITGQTIQIAQPVMVTIPAVSPPQQPQSQPLPKPVPPPSSVPEQHQHQHHQQQPQQPQQQQPPPPQKTELVQHQPSPTELVIAQQEQSEIVGSSDPVSSSRWPKSEVLTLIKIRTGLESSYQEAGPKGPLWEEVSAQMHRLGFNRSAKRCKEKWENINKYFKKVKESNKKRPEDAKTCPYYSQLDALYQKKLLGGIGSSTSTQNKQGQEINLDSNPNQSSQERGDMLAITSPQPRLLQIDTEVQKSSTSNKNGENSGGSSLQVPTSNGGLRPSFFEEGPMKKPEDIVKELEQQQQQAVMGKSDILDEEEDTEDDDDDNDEEDQRKTVYKIQFKRQNPGSANGGNPASSFLAMVQ